MRKVMIFLLLSAVCVAADHAPLPKQLFEAKTIYIDNRSGYADIADKVYAELKKWERFQVVETPEKADAIFLVTSSTEITGYSGRTNTSTYGNTAYSNTSLEADQSGYTHLQIVDHASGQILWSATRKWVPFRSATKGIVKDLRKRMEEQERKR